jgi:hypothetical protein
MIWHVLVILKFLCHLEQLGSNFLTWFCPESISILLPMHSVRNSSHPFFVILNLKTVKQTVQWFALGISLLCITLSSTELRTDRRRISFPSFDIALESIWYVCGPYMHACMMRVGSRCLVICCHGGRALSWIKSLLAKLLEKLQEIDLNYNDRLYLVPANSAICSARQNNVDF